MTSQSPTRVAVQNRHRKPAGYLIRVSARAGGSDDRVNPSTRAGIWSIRVNLPATQSAARILPSGGPLRLAIEATRTLKLLASRIFSRGPLLIHDFCRGIKAPGKPFSFPLVHDANQSSGSLFEAFQFSPALRSSVAHGQTMQRKDARSHEQCTREYE